MVEYTGAWSADEVERFLDRATVPVRLACHTPSDRLWLVTLWYEFADATFLCATGREATIVQYLERDASVAFEVSTNEPPYRGVRGNGRAVIGPDPDKAVLQSLLERYLGGTDSQLADRLLADHREEVAIRLEPDRLYSWDYSERMADVESA
ncbi:MAG: pyridoxamine 5'-phosphate oxidase family protein [Halobacteriales archaeon]